MTVPAADTREVVACRTIGHAWDQLPHTPGKAEILLRCTRCASERLDPVDVTTFAVRGRRYRYSAGYLLSKADGERPTKDEWRRQFLLVTGVINRRGRIR